MCSNVVVVVAHYICYSWTLWYHSVTANDPAKRHVSKETSAMPHVRHVHVKRGRYSQSMTLWVL